MMPPKCPICNSDYVLPYRYSERLCCKYSNENPIMLTNGLYLPHYSIHTTVLSENYVFKHNNSIFILANYHKDSKSFFNIHNLACGKNYILLIIFSQLILMQKID